MTSSKGRSPPMSRCATSSPACGTSPMSTGRSSSNACRWSTPCSPRAAISRRWILRPATSTAPPSRSSPGDRASTSWRSRIAPSAAAAAATERRRKDPGYHLTAEGRAAFEAALGFRPSFSTIASRAYRALGVGGYAGAGALVALLLLGFPVLFHVEASVDWILLGVLGLLGAVPAIDSAVALVNQGVTRRFGATQVPGLELRGEVPAHLRTLVVVPTLLTRPESDHRAGRATGNPSSRQHRRGDPVRLALGLARCGKRDGRGRRRAVADCRRSHCPAEPPARAGARRRPVPAAPPPAGVERKPAPVDRLGAQARQAARAEPPAARRPGHDLPQPRRAPADGARRTSIMSITLDADTQASARTRCGG